MLGVEYRGRGEREEERCSCCFSSDECLVTSMEAEEGGKRKGIGGVAFAVMSVW